jgi:hypothetical protein
MTTPELAKKKWKRKVKGEKWKKGVTGKENDFCEGIKEFLGVTSCNPDIVNAWRTGVEEVTASQFDHAVSGKEEKWFERYKEKMSGK